METLFWINAVVFTCIIVALLIRVITIMIEGKQLDTVTFVLLATMNLSAISAQILNYLVQIK